jgi:hypothetical protein
LPILPTAQEPRVWEDVDDRSAESCFPVGHELLRIEIREFVPQELHETLVELHFPARHHDREHRNGGAMVVGDDVQDLRRANVERLHVAGGDRKSGVGEVERRRCVHRVDVVSLAEDDRVVFFSWRKMTRTRTCSINISSPSQIAPNSSCFWTILQKQYLKGARINEKFRVEEVGVENEVY